LQQGPRRHRKLPMDQAEVARISKALSDPARLRIYAAISANHEMFCGELVEKHGLTPGTISHHLKVLADANLIECRRDGQFIYNRSKPETIREYSRALATIAGKKIAGKTKAASKG
jgi:ArsR family transcriptional regulator